MLQPSPYPTLLYALPRQNMIANALAYTLGYSTYYIPAYVLVCPTTLRYMADALAYAQSCGQGPIRVCQVPEFPATPVYSPFSTKNLTRGFSMGIRTRPAGFEWT